jgi:hypothetical protein
MGSVVKASCVYSEGRRESRDDGKDGIDKSLGGWQWGNRKKI